MANIIGVFKVKVWSLAMSPKLAVSASCDWRVNQSYQAHTDTHHIKGVIWRVNDITDFWREHQVSHWCGLLVLTPSVWSASIDLVGVFDFVFYEIDLIFYFLKNDLIFYFLRNWFDILFSKNAKKCFFYEDKSDFRKLQNTEKTIPKAYCA